MEEILTGVNWPAVVVGAVVAFLIGWLWYSPKMFGVKWAAGVGVDPGSAAGMPVGAMVLQGVGLFLMSWFVGVTAVQMALLTVILATLAFATLFFSSGLFGRKSTAAAMIDSGYWIVALVVMILIQGIVGRMMS